MIRTFLFWSILLCACSPNALYPEAAPTNPATVLPSEIATALSTSEVPTDELLPAPTNEVLPPPKLIATLATPHIEQGPDGASTAIPSNPQDCGYQWAYQGLPELSSEFQESIQRLQPNAQANAYVFGENCILEDGSVARFLAKETDFNITLQVADLSSESELGEWIVKVMQVIESIPADQIVGPGPGMVSLTFQANNDQKNVSFYIDRYQALPPGLSNAEIYQALQNP